MCVHVARLHMNARWDHIAPDATERSTSPRPGRWWRSSQGWCGEALGTALGCSPAGDPPKVWPHFCISALETPHTCRPEDMVLFLNCKRSANAYACAAQGTYPPWESVSPQLSSRFWVPEPQDLEHWRTREGTSRALLTVSSAQSEVCGAFAFRLSVQIQCRFSNQVAASKRMSLVSLLIMCVLVEHSIKQLVAPSHTSFMFNVLLLDSHYDGIFAK